jgi:hypothetical protein
METLAEQVQCPANCLVKLLPTAKRVYWCSILPAKTHVVLAGAMLTFQLHSLHFFLCLCAKICTSLWLPQA